MCPLQTDSSAALAGQWSSAGSRSRRWREQSDCKSKDSWISFSGGEANDGEKKDSILGPFLLEIVDKWWPFWRNNDQI